jgi:energy-coupling factor transport system permease protein
VSQFEFLRSVPFGQYLPVGSILHRLDPRARMVAFTVIILALTFSRSLMGLLIGCAVVLVGFTGREDPIPLCLPGVIAALTFFIPFGHSPDLFKRQPAERVDTGGNWAGKDYSVGPGGGCEVTHSLYRVDSGDWAGDLYHLYRRNDPGVERHVSPAGENGAPRSGSGDDGAGHTALFTHACPDGRANCQIAGVSGRRLDSRPRNLIARVRQVIPVIVPLFLSSLHRAENMALAMDARAYGSSVQRTSLVELRLKAADGLLLGISFLAGAAILILK